MAKVFKTGESVNDALRGIIKEAPSKRPSSDGLGTAIVRLFAKTGLKKDTAELRGKQAKPALFSK